MLPPTTAPVWHSVPPLKRTLNALRYSGISPVIVARAAGISKTHLFDIADGKVGASRDAAGKVSQALGLPLEDLFPELSQQENADPQATPVAEAGLSG